MFQRASKRGADVRQTLLEVIEQAAKQGPGYFQSRTILSQTAELLGIRGNLDAERALLTIWSDLFLQGLLAWGHNLDNPEPPFVHLTERGRRVLTAVSRDPSNPAGYLAHLATAGGLDAIAMSYVTEGVHTYNAACYKAAAVMVGAASERLVLELRDAVVARLGVVGRAPHADLNDWRVKRVLDAVEREIDAHGRVMPVKLREAYGAVWPAFTQQIRAARNDAGHPTSIDPVTADTVHASLLIFPELAKLQAELRGWVAANMP